MIPVKSSTVSIHARRCLASVTGVFKATNTLEGSRNYLFQDKNVNRRNVGRPSTDNSSVRSVDAVHHCCRSACECYDNDKDHRCRWHRPVVCYTDLYREKFERNSNILKHFTGFPAGTEIACMMTACKVRIAIWTVKSLLPLELLLILVWLPL